MIILKNKPIKTVFHFFSVLVVSFFSITGCTVKEYPITTENDIQPLKEQNQVIIADGTNSKTEQNIIEQNTTEQPQQQNPPQKEEQTNTTIKTSQKEQTDISSQKNSNSSSFLNWVILSLMYCITSSAKFPSSKIDFLLYNCCNSLSAVIPNDAVAVFNNGLILSLGARCPP